MRHEGFEVPVAVQQWVAALNASRRNHCVDRLASRDAQGSQLPVVFGSLHGDIKASQLNHDQRGQQFSGWIEVLVAGETLKHFDQYQIAYRQRLAAKQAVQPFGLRRWVAAKVVDPDTGVDQNHRSVLIASRSPCQINLPLKRRISACFFSCSKVRRPSSTASRFVFKPVARSVSSINLSSITMLVRMVGIHRLINTHPSWE